MRVGVLGAGVIGLTTALVLARQGHVVEIVAERIGPEADSRTATAIWHVYLVDPNDLSVLRWSSTTLQQLIDLVTSHPEAGVEMVDGLELFRDSDPELPSWHSIPPKFEMLREKELQSFGGVRWGYRITAPVANMEKYLPWLVSKVEAEGVSITRQRVDRVHDLLGDYDAVANCTGLGARVVVPDASLVPVRGQYLAFAESELTVAEYIGDDQNPDGMAYVIARDGEVLIGGTEEYGVEDETFQEDPHALLIRASEFCEDVRALDPALANRVVGLRPFRPAGVRLDAVTIGETLVVNNYGHGGSGFSLAWGCAEDVGALMALEAARRV